MQQEGVSRQPHEARCSNLEKVTKFRGPLQRNNQVEPFNTRLRDALLNGQQFDSLLEARVMIND